MFKIQKWCPQPILCLPDVTLKLPEGHNAHVPADAPPQPLRYRLAAHDEAEQVEQKDAPGSSHKERIPIHASVTWIVQSKSQKGSRSCNDFFNKSRETALML